MTRPDAVASGLAQLHLGDVAELGTSAGGRPIAAGRYGDFGRVFDAGLLHGFRPPG